MSLPVDGCPFCNIVLGRSSGDFDRLLADSGRVLLIPALGMFVPGYLLLVTRQHLRSFAFLDRNQLAETEVWLDKLLMRLGREFGTYLSFEHGMGSEHTLPSGACVDHAHLHLIPSGRAVEQIQKALPWQQLSGLDELAGWRGQTYSYLSWNGSHLVSSEPALPGQWVRRLAAGALGVTTWDWAVYPGETELAETLHRLPPLKALAGTADVLTSFTG